MLLMRDCGAPRRSGARRRAAALVRASRTSRTRQTGTTARCAVVRTPSHPLENGSLAEGCRAVHIARAPGKNGAGGPRLHTSFAPKPSTCWLRAPSSPRAPLWARAAFTAPRPGALPSAAGRRAARALRRRCRGAGRTCAYRAAHLHAAVADGLRVPPFPRKVLGCDGCSRGAVGPRHRRARAPERLPGWRLRCAPARTAPSPLAHLLPSTTGEPTSSYRPSAALARAPERRALRSAGVSCGCCARGCLAAHPAARHVPHSAHLLYLL